MRTATLYTADRKLVNVYGGFIPYHIRDPIQIQSFCNPEFLDGAEVKSHVNIHHLPVERWVFDEQEFLIALDPLLREIVQYKIDTAEKGVRDIAQARINELNVKIKVLQSRTVWDMIKLKFRRVKK